MDTQSINDHAMGTAEAKITLIQYADFQCPFSADAFPVIKETVTAFSSKINFIYRHFPLVHLHPSAMLLAQFAEAAGIQGYFWETHEFLFSHQASMSKEELERYLGIIEVDQDQFYEDLRSQNVIDKVERDLYAGKESSVLKTPSFVLNGQLYQNEWHQSGLKDQIKALLR